jgi:hypothetical protein
MSPRPFALAVVAASIAVVFSAIFSHAHDHSAHRAEQQRRVAEARAAQMVDAPGDKPNDPQCRLTIRLVDAKERTRLGGLVRLTNLTTGSAVPLTGEIHRELQWHAVGAESIVSVPAAKLRIDAFHGIETTLATREIDLTGRADATVEVPLTRFYNPRMLGLRSGNTHLHLMKLSYLEALRYLRTVPAADGLDVVYLSHLRRVTAERDYITNEIVENGLSGQELQRLNQFGSVFGLGEEHRHNFGPGGEGFGHVMLLDIKRLVQPVSIGPGIMGDGTDERPLRVGIKQARDDGATVIWCHNTFGYEDVPNWFAGVLDAQNIFDGGNHGSYADTFYKYLNVGLRVPFSTGTDWFIYDFSRVYVPVREPVTSQRWLMSLRAGRSYITNGTFLEFQVDNHRSGDTLELTKPTMVRVRGRGAGRNDFRGLELVHNGDVVNSVSTRSAEGHFTADLDVPVTLDRPGWLALRIPLEAGRNELDKPLFAHTSPVYVDFAGRRPFDSKIARELVRDMEASIRSIGEKAKFGDDAERERVLQVHRAAIVELSKRLDAQ